MSNPSQYSYGHGGGRYVICKVVNRKDDPEQSGRLQVRVVGYQNDESTIPDDKLLWARPSFPINNPMNGGVGGPVTGQMEDSYVMGYFADDGQQLMLTHSIGKAGVDKNGQLDKSGRNHDTNKHSRDPDHEGGDLRFDKDAKNYGDKSSMEYARNESKNPYGRGTVKDGDIDPNKSWSLGMFKHDDV